MKWMKWLPWRYAISRLARSQGFIDPVAVLSKLHQFAQPSEVTEPIELMRAGVILQARGLINTRAIQHNLDWVWPYWVERQFNPHDPSFIPRAFSITHVNLTHRNWTALGQPDSAQMPLVDPRGLVTPLFDGWSLDAWIIPAQGDPLLPAREPHVEQRMAPSDEVVVHTAVERDGLKLVNEADVIRANGTPMCRLQSEATADRPAYLVLSIRPTNPEGVSFINEIEFVRDDGRSLLRVNDETNVQLDRMPDKVLMSDYRRGDVFADLPDGPDAQAVQCDVGLATAAAVYPLVPGEPSRLSVTVPLTGPSAHPEPGLKKHYTLPTGAHHEQENWQAALRDTCQIDVPDQRIVSLFRNALRNLILFSPDEVYPGPFTSKRFWFRDAAFILNAMMTVGLTARTRRVLEHYPDRQQANGFFRSQEGEWDANGQAIYMLDRFRRLTGAPLPERFVEAMRRGARWIGRKRTADDLPEPHAGLLPAGFSAEHLGPNDYFYWDDFWSAAGLRAAAATLQEAGDDATAEWSSAESESLLRSIDRSLEQTASNRRLAGVPASPYRRMDAGAIGSLAGSYPTQLWEPRDPRMLATADFIFEHCTVHNGFFQDVIHSGINAYLTLHLAEVLLRADDERHIQLVNGLAELASPTGNWPEAIHPHTRGGCMGDGQHIWAAAEWVLMLRNWFVREEGARLVIGSGIPSAWLREEGALRFGPTATPHGPLSVAISCHTNNLFVEWQADWHTDQPEMEVRLMGESHPVAPDKAAVRIER
jgi:hypothetical protein